MDQERIKKIKESLDDVHNWPEVYIFKFILPSSSEQYKELLAIFPMTVEVSKKLSRKGNYTSYTIKEFIISAEEVLERYKSAYKLEGIIAL